MGLLKRKNSSNEASHSYNEEKISKTPFVTVICKGKLTKILAFALFFLMTIRVAASYFLTCNSMLKLGITVGHGELGKMHNGCDFADNANKIDVASMYISPQELHEKIKQGLVVTPSTTSIPRIFHQSYKSTLVSETVFPFIKSWHDKLATEAEQSADPSIPWVFVWWEDDDYDWLMKNFYPEYYDTFRSMFHIIMKADTARYFMLDFFGGIYADLDVKYTPEVAGDTVTSVFEERVDSSRKRVVFFHNCQDNAFAASTPKASFWDVVHRAWYNAAHDPKKLGKVNLITGIDMLKHVCKEESKDRGDTVPGLLIYGYEPGDKDHPGGQISIHYGTNSWRWSTKKEDILYYINMTIACVTVLFIAVILATIRKRYKYSPLYQN